MSESNTKGGVRLPDYLRDMALSRIEDLMIQAMPWKRIIAILSTEGLTESESTAKKWRAEIQRRWAEEEREVRPAHKNLRRAQAEERYRRMCERSDAAASANPPDLRSCAMLEREATRLLGVLVALDGLALPVQAKPDERLGVASMAPHEREAEIAKLLAERAAAHARRPPSEGN